jgi:hypothetical protein
MTGHEQYNSIVDMTTREFVELVRTSFFCVNSIIDTLLCLNFVCSVILTLIAIVKIYESWRKRLSGTLSHRPLDVYCNQVKRCIEIALECLIPNRQERPTIQAIVSHLNDTEIMIGDQGMQNEQVQSLAIYLYLSAFNLSSLCLEMKMEFL